MSTTDQQLATLEKVASHDAVGGYRAPFVTRGIAELEDAGLVAVVRFRDGVRVRLTAAGREVLDG